MADVLNELISNKRYDKRKTLFLNAEHCYIIISADFLRTIFVFEFAFIWLWPRGVFSFAIPATVPKEFKYVFECNIKTVVCIFNTE